MSAAPAGLSSDPFSLAGKTVLVTGASSGLGQAACRMIAQCGGSVVATGRDEARLAATVASLSDSAGQTHAECIADLLLPEAIGELVATLGKLDGLVLAAGVAQVSPLRYTTPKVLSRSMSINFESRLALCQALMAKRRFNAGASLVFISTLSVTQGVTGHAAYAASMSANEGASRAIAAECVGSGMRSNVIAPGLVRTPVLEAGDVPREKMDELIARYPLGIGEPEDVAAAAVYLLAPASRWVTGQVIRMDGGYTLDV